jgi:hypothetical protein
MQDHGLDNLHFIFMCFASRILPNSILHTSDTNHISDFYLRQSNPFWTSSKICPSTEISVCYLLCTISHWILIEIVFSTWNDCVPLHSLPLLINLFVFIMLFSNEMIAKFQTNCRQQRLKILDNVKMSLCQMNRMPHWFITVHHYHFYHTMKRKLPFFIQPFSLLELRSVRTQHWLH